ncbi:MAG TPA: T9SS type A sorting domain-containing protein [Flavobacterium sp.]|nr:T9SS type A sorting domain-containing protein [Flavobacterium sp.]
MKRIYIVVILLQAALASAQLWPSQSWSSAANLTGVMDADGINDLSGLHFNPTNNRLYCVQGDGRLRVLQLNTATNSFTQFASKAITGGPEGITQANLNANEFYTIDENNYEIRRYTHSANFSSVTLFKHWNLLASPSPMQDTGNNGPEGIVFIPDSFLTASGFISQQSGQLYTSAKGLGGLFFVAHQDEGYIWVFDVNPNANDDFAYVGKYKTNRSESCDLSFDRSMGLLYILHNITGSNKIEVTNLSSAVVSGNERKFNITEEFAVADPNDGNENIEGFAMMPKCQTGIVSAWLCRDVESNEGDSILQDALRWFSPFNASGSCVPLADVGFESIENISIAPNPANAQITISGKMNNVSIQIMNSLGQIVLRKNNVNDNSTIDISALLSGVYILEVNSNDTISRIKWIKN